MVLVQILARIIASLIGLVMSLVALWRWCSDHNFPHL